MKEKIINLLLTDEVSYLSHLKMIEQYGDKIIYKLIEKQNEWALSLLIPTCLSSFDIAAYPETTYIVYIAASGTNTSRDIVCELPTDCHLVFKVSKFREKESIKERFNPTFIKSFVSYSTDKPIINNYSSVIFASKIDELLLPLWLENGYDRGDIENYFNKGANSFSVFSGNKPLSTCIIFSSSKNIWEIGAVRTISNERGKGFGKLVVGAAVNHIIKMGKKPNYQVMHANLSSIKLAESLGLQNILTLEHLYY